MAKSDASKRKGIGGWLLVVLLMSIWMFIVGLLVGRGTAPIRFDLEKLQKELTSLRKDAAQRKNGSDASAPQVKKKTDLDFYEALKERRGKNKQKPLPVKPKETLKPGKAVVEKATPPKEKPKKAPVKKSPAEVVKTKEPKGNLTIQVAALKDPVVAGQMVGKLKKKGFAAYRTVVEIPGKGTWYRIRIGTYQTRAESADTLKKLEQEGLNGFLVNK